MGLLFTFTLVSGTISAQETVVVGQVLNKVDQSPISQVNVFFKNSEKVVQTNEEGYFLIRTTEKYTTLIFSCIGFKQEQIKLKPGQSVGIQVQLTEENTLLQEVFVTPGANPAIDLMKKVRLLKTENDISRQKGFNALSTEQNLVLLSKINQRSLSKRIFDQLKKGNISHSDSALVLPLYMAESNYELTGNVKKQLSKNIFSSPEEGEKLLEKMAGEMTSDLNFYENSISIFGKSMISPLATIGNAYYNYYLTDSLKAETGKQYEVHFRTRNAKNLAFNGKLWIDSATFALTKIEAELPPQANINFIHNLHISESFVSLPDKHWMRKSDEMALNMNYALLIDSLHPHPEIFIKRSSSYQSGKSNSLQTGSFALSNYDQTTLNEKLSDLNNTPLLRTAKYIAKVVLTGYLPMGKINIGSILQLGRLSDIEGLRLSLPFVTNEKLWKNVAVGGYVGYGTKNQTVKYSAFGQYKLPGDLKRVIGVSYTDDYRRIDYNYNDFMYRENPLVSGDEDITTTLLMLWSANRLNPRKEFNVSFSNDWNSDIESSLYLRNNKLYSNTSLPMYLNGSNFNSISQRSVTLNTRFSFNEKTYENHLQRVYILNTNPIFGITMEGGQYTVGSKNGEYGKILGTLKQYVRLDYGELYYGVEAGYILGKVPYPLLEIPSGSENGGYGIYKINVPVQTGSGGYSMYQYNMMKYMEYGADKYLNLQGELTLNGLLMNQLPIIKHLNLRELLSFKMAYGSLSNSHQTVLTLPSFMEPLRKPYMEVGAGITNILHIFSIQSVWRLTDINKPGVFRWGIRSSLNISF